MDIKITFLCPVCRAGFRGTKECSRCGVDLTIIMTLAARSQLCREAARKAIHSRDYEKAHKLATKAQKIHETETGRRLFLLKSWINTDFSFGVGP